MEDKLTEPLGTIGFFVKKGNSYAHIGEAKVIANNQYGIQVYLHTLCGSTNPHATDVPYSEVKRYYKEIKEDHGNVVNLFHGSGRFEKLHRCGTCINKLHHRSPEPLIQEIIYGTGKRESMKSVQEIEPEQRQKRVGFNATHGAHFVHISEVIVKRINKDWGNIRVHPICNLVVPSTSDNFNWPIDTEIPQKFIDGTVDNTAALDVYNDIAPRKNDICDTCLKKIATSTDQDIVDLFHKNDGVELKVVTDKPDKPEMLKLFVEANTIINGQRQIDYGDKTESFTRIAGLWGAYLGIKLGPADVVDMMILLKLSRNKGGKASDIKKRKRDGYRDIVGYSGCMEIMDLLADDNDKIE